MSKMNYSILTDEKRIFASFVIYLHGIFIKEIKKDFLSITITKLRFFVYHKN